MRWVGLVTVCVIFCAIICNGQNVSHTFSHEVKMIHCVTFPMSRKSPSWGCITHGMNITWAWINVVFSLHFNTTKIVVIWEFHTLKINQSDLRPLSRVSTGPWKTLKPWKWDSGPWRTLKTSKLANIGSGPWERP